MVPDTVYRILVVDDEERIRGAVRRVLEAQGFQTWEAADGQEALDQLESLNPDLVLVDLMMPVMDGMTFLREARKRHPDMAFVVITGYATLEKAVEAMQKGADDFLAKPFKPQELRLVVERVLKRVRTIQDMAIEKSRNRVLVESMSNGVLVVDAAGKVVIMNPALRRFVGWEQGEPWGAPMEEAVPCPEVLDRLGMILSRRQLAPESLSCQIAMSPHGEEVHLQVRCAPFLDGRSHMVGAVAVFDDVTALRRLDELKSEYVSTVAHEIASPLGSVLGQLQNLASGLAGELNPEQARILNRARERIAGIVSLSKDLLDLAKIEAGSLGEPEPVDLLPILEESVDLLRGKAEDKGQSMELNVQGPLPPVLAIAREMQEVFVNLVSNAVKYTPEGGSIEVSAGADNGRVVVAVRDTGYGIPPEELDSVFQRFHRVKSADTRHIVGTGLGLAIVKRVVESAGGEIKVGSTLGQGSTFTVSLPVLAEA